MRTLKSEGQSQIEVQINKTQIERHVKKIYKTKSEFEGAMDIAQLIYVEDNP